MNSESKKLLQKESQSETDSQFQVFQEDNESYDVSVNNAVQSLRKKRKRKKRKSTNGSVEIKEGISDKVETSSETKDDQSVQIIASRKRKRNRGKGKRLNGMEKKVDVPQTSANYPKELSSNSGISCNWKKLCQAIGTSEVSKSEQSHRAPKLQKTDNRKELNRNHSQSKSMPDEIWFDGVDKELIKSSAESSFNGTRRKENVLVKEGSFAGLTSAVAMDCEMVGIGENGADSMLARVSIVNLMGNCIYDKYVKPTEPVVDYRTPVSGIRPSNLEKGEDFKTVQKEVSDILEKRILVGHAVHNDLKVLFLTHPKRRIRDSSMYKPFRKVSQGNTPSLKKLAEKLLGVKVQEGEHSSVQDAQAAMRLYTMYKIEWENAMKKKKLKQKKSTSEASKSSSAVKKLANSPTTKKFSQLKI